MPAFTVSAAARLCGVDRRTLQRAIQAGRLPLDTQHCLSREALIAAGYLDAATPQTMPHRTPHVASQDTPHMTPQDTSQDMPQETSQELGQATALLALLERLTTAITDLHAEVRSLRDDLRQMPQRTPQARSGCAAGHAAGDAAGDRSCAAGSPAGGATCRRGAAGATSNAHPPAWAPAPDPAGHCRDRGPL